MKLFTKGNFIRFILSIVLTASGTGAGLYYANQNRSEYIHSEDTKVKNAPKPVIEESISLDKKEEYKNVLNNLGVEEKNEVIIRPNTIVTPQPTPIPTPNPTPTPTPEPILYINKFAYIPEDTIIFSDLKASEIEDIEMYQKVLVLEEVADYYYVQTDDLRYGYILKNKIEFLPDTLVEVDISDQTLNLYRDNEIILTTLVVTGGDYDNRNTTLGYFPIKEKTYDTYLKGKQYDDGTYEYNTHVDYWMPFNGGIGLHDATFRSEFGGEIYKTNGSHGCVNMPYDKAEELFAEVEVGDMVLVHK